MREQPTLSAAVATVLRASTCTLARKVAPMPVFLPSGIALLSVREERRTGNAVLRIKMRCITVDKATLQLQRRLKLTRAQTKVAYGLAVGNTNAEIAEAIGISAHTVRRHIEAIYDKLKVSSRAALEAHMRRCVSSTWQNWDTHGTA